MRRLLAVSALLIAPAAHAQVEDTQLWTQTNMNIPIAKRARITMEGIARGSDRLGGLYQTEVGILVSRKLSKHIELGAGFRHVGSHSGNRADDEDRLRQHVVFTYGRMSGRFRIDERFHPDGPEIGFRIRPLIRYNHPIGKRWALFVSHESFIMPNSTDWGQRSGYDRMRNIAGVVVPVLKNATADVGYLNQYRPGRDGSRPQMDHALSIQLSVNL